MNHPINCPNCGHDFPSGYYLAATGQPTKLQNGDTFVCNHCFHFCEYQNGTYIEQAEPSRETMMQFFRWLQARALKDMTGV